MICDKPLKVFEDPKCVNSVILGNNHLSNLLLWMPLGLQGISDRLDM
jgi:hypothetical protein